VADSVTHLKRDGYVSLSHQNRDLGDGIVNTPICPRTPYTDLENVWGVGGRHHCYLKRDWGSGVGTSSIGLHNVRRRSLLAFVLRNREDATAGKLTSKPTQLHRDQHPSVHNISNYGA